VVLEATPPIASQTGIKQMTICLNYLHTIYIFLKKFSAFDTFATLQTNTLPLLYAFIYRYFARSDNVRMILKFDKSRAY